MAIISVGPNAVDSTQFYQIEGYESQSPTYSTFASGNMINVQTLTKVILTDASGTTIGQNTYGQAYFYSYEKNATTGQYQYVQSSTGKIYRILDIAGGGGTYNFQKADGTTYSITSVHTGSMVLEEVDDTGVPTGSPLYTVWGARPAYSDDRWDPDYFADKVLSVNITSQTNLTSNQFALATYNGSLVAACFVEGSLIKTTMGYKAIEDIVSGEKVCTASGAIRQVLWVGSSDVDLIRHPEMRPIIFEAGSILGNKSRFCVSPNHHVQVSCLAVEVIMGSFDGLVAAKHLVGAPLVSIDENVKSVVYYHLLLDEFDLVMSEDNVISESLMLGPISISAYSADQQREIRSLFPDLAHKFASDVYPHPTLTAAEGKTLAKLI